MANPIVTSRTDLLSITNAAARFYGSIVKNGWEVTAWGFYYYKTSSGIETAVYKASGVDYGETIFSYFTSGSPLLPNTSYTWRARAYCRKWNSETESYDYYEDFGDWEEFTTHAYCEPYTMHVYNVNKVNDTCNMSTILQDTDGGNCVEVGFQISTTRSLAGLVKTATVGSGLTEGLAIIAEVTGLSLDTDYYVRPYAKSTSGHIFYHGGASSEDENWEGGWRHFSTKDNTPKMARVENAGYPGGNALEYLVLLDENGLETNAYILYTSGDGFQVTIDSDGNAVYGFGISTDYRIAKRSIESGSLEGIRSSYYTVGIFYHSDGYLYTVEREDSNYYIRRRDKISHGIIAEINTGTDYKVGLALDSENRIYTINTKVYGHHTLERWSLSPSYTITIINQVNKQFTISGLHAEEFTNGITFNIVGSSSNDGSYTVDTDATEIDNTTIITVIQEIPSESGAKGYITDNSGGKTDQIDLLKAMNYGNIGISENYIFCGAYFDYPVKVNMAMTSKSTWYPSGENWHDWGWYFFISMWESKILVEGSNDSDINSSRRIACYDDDGETLIWSQESFQGLDGMGGLPYESGQELENVKAEKHRALARIRLYGEIL